MDNFKEKRIAILGYGLEGKSLASFILKEDPSEIKVFDQNSIDLEPEHEERVMFEQTDIDKADLSAFDVIFRSPGIKPSLVNAPQEKVSSLIDLFLSRAKGKKIGVTGTKGKSSTVLLIEKILKLNSKEVFIGGNIGESPLDFLEDLTDESYSVLEVSSFQLMDLKNAFDIAVILPIIQDHLDYHQDLGEYYLAKRRIIEVSQKTKIISFEGNREALKLNDLNNELVLFCDEKNAELEEISKKLQIPLIDIVAAYAFSKTENLEFSKEGIIQGFKKLPFRVELVGQISNTKFYNDSASTNPISTQKALETVTGSTGLIMGGISKGLPLDDLARSITDNDGVRAVYLFGSEANNLEGELEKSQYPGDVVRADTLEEIFDKLDLGVDNIVFSPAFASFDQYKNYKQRGERFNELFNSLKCKNI
jgi:UDP-N-acetylmuramoylalanine--D-glutamate ligase